MQIGHARQRWKSLRDTFTRKVRKIAIIEAAGGYSGSGEDPCQWKYFQQLKFLEHVIHTHRPRLQPANGSNGTTQPTKNPLALPNLTLSINVSQPPPLASPLSSDVCASKRTHLDYNHKAVNKRRFWYSSMMLVNSGECFQFKYSFFFMFVLSLSIATTKRRRTLGHKEPGPFRMNAN